MMASRSGPFAGCSLEGGGLVLEGRQVKVRLQQLRGAQGPVHVDWLRFSVPKDAVVTAGFYLDSQYEALASYDGSQWDTQTRIQRLRAMIDHVTLDGSALAGARILGREVVAVLGEDFALVEEPNLGRDFFAFRLPITRCGVEVGWVGGGASSSKPQQRQQAAVLHVNLYGEACLFVGRDSLAKLAALGQRYEGRITRCDLAVDFFDGIEGGMSGLEAMYLDGRMDVRGKRPKVGHAGDWINKRACTFYLGSRDAGKYTRVYRKGDQLFPLEANDPWVRMELQWGDQLRVLPWDMLNNPAAYFAAASDFHSWMLAQASVQQVEPASVPCKPDAAAMNATGEAFRKLHWLMRTAGPSIALAFKHLADGEFLALIDTHRIPRRLAKFNAGEIAKGMGDAALRFFNGLEREPALLHG